MSNALLRSLGVSILAFPATASASSVQADAGLAVVAWNFDASPYTGTAVFESDAEPFIARNLEVEFHGFFGLDAGIGYLTNELFGAAGLSARDEIVGVDDPILASLLGFIRGDYGPIAIDVETQLRRFELQRTFTGLWIDGALPIQYLPGEGEAVSLSPGQHVNFSSEQLDLAIRAGIDAMFLFGEGDAVRPEDGSRLDFYVGYHLLQYSAPLVASFDMEGNFAEVFMATQFSGHLLDAGLWYASAPPAPGEFGFKVRIPTELGFASAYNEYVEGSGGVMIGLGAEGSVSYAFEVSETILGLVELGISAEWFSANLGHVEATVKKPIPYVNLIGESGSLSPETPMELSVDREETIVKPYLNLRLDFDVSPSS